MIESHLRERVAMAFAEHLGDVLERDVFVGRRSGRPEPPYTVVTVKRMPPAPGSEGEAAVAEVRIVHVSDAADSDADEHSARIRDLERAIWSIPRPAIDLKNGVALLGFELDDVGQAAGQDDDGRKLYADVFQLTAGVMEA
jgi:hypothetical protein